MHFKNYFLVLISVISFSFLASNHAFGCHAISLVNYNQQTINATSITLNAASDSPTCGCSTYWLDVEVRCIGQAFDAAAFSPGFNGPLTTYPYYQSIPMQKPNCVVQNYPGVNVPFAGLCPGTTYQYRMRENHNGQVGPWCPTQTFTVPGTMPTFTATVTTTNNNICAGNCVTLTATPTGGCQIAVLYSWSNGATTPSITVCPATTTTYTCTVTDDCSNQQVVLPMTISVVPAPVAGTASVNPASVCSGQTVDLTLTGSSGGIQWQSAPNSGGPFTNIGGATATPFTTAGLTSNTCFRAEVTGCGAPVYSNVVCITINPTPTITIPAQTVCAGSPATLTPNVNPAGGTYLWNTGATTSTLTDAPAGTTTYTLTYTANGCPQTATGDIIVNPLPSVTVNTVNICNGNPGTLTATPDIAGGTYLWNTGATTQNISETPVISTTYTVTYTLNGCQATGSGMINMGVNPVPSFSAPPLCDGNPINFFDNTPGNITSWSWDFGDGNTSNLQNPTHQYAVSGTYSVTLTAYDGPCSGTTTIPITVFAVPVASFTSTPACANSTTTFTNTSTGAPTIFDWEITGGTPASASTFNASTVYATGGNYTVELYVETADGCADSVTANITIPDLPVVDFSFVEQCLGTPTCFTDLTTVNGSTISNYNWNFGDGNTSTTQNPCNNYATSGAYTVTLSATSAAGCTGNIASYTVNAFDNPTADFTTSPVCFGTATQFNNTSIGGLITDWDFGDGNVSSLSSPSHTYAIAGTYNVTLTVTTGSCTDNITQAITVNPLPVADFNVTTACPNLNSNFTDASTVSSGSITNWDWTFSSGTPGSSTTQNPSVTFASGGNYDATLIVTTNTGCTDTLNQSFNIPYTPVADFSFTLVCQGNQTCFTDLSSVTGSTITGWNYDFGDGNTSILQNPCNLYASSGAFSSTLTVTSADGCVSNATPYSVDVFSLPVASFTVNNVCQAFEAVFTNTSNGAANYDWDFDDGNTASTQNTTHFYNTPGTYNVTLIISSGSGCADTITNPVTIYPMPVADFNFTNVCLNNVMNFTDVSTVSSGTINGWNWNFGDTQTSTVQNPSNTYIADGNYTVSLTITTNNGCTDNTSEQVTVYPLPEINFTSNSVCLNATTNFTNGTTINSGAVATYTWDFGDGTGTSSLVNPSYVYTNYGIFTVVLDATSDNGCVSSETVDITVHPNPVVDFTGDDLAGCNTHCVNFTNNSSIASGTITNWVWDFGDGNISTQMNPSNCYYNSTLNNQMYTIQLVATSDNGCDNAVTINNYITVYPDVIAEFSFGPQPTTILDNNILFINETVNGVSYTWTFGDGNTSTDINPSNTYGEVGTYEVILAATSVNGCVDTISHLVEIGPDFIIYVPNTFTPDNDGVNDVFFPVLEGFDPLRFNLQIFNRWGDLIFESAFPQSGWDGNYKGLPAKDDTYVWKINVKDIVYGKQREFVGHVNLLR